LLNKDPAAINQELSSLLDYTNPSVKKFINGFLDRVANQRQYEQ